MTGIVRQLAIFVVSSTLSLFSFAQSDLNSDIKSDQDSIEQITVIGVSPLNPGGNSLSSQFADQDDIKRIQSSSLTDFLDQGFFGITLNQAQNNPLQPDLQYRGFAASSALGLQQGLTVWVVPWRLTPRQGSILPVIL